MGWWIEWKKNKLYPQSLGNNLALWDMQKLDGLVDGLVQICNLHPLTAHLPIYRDKL